MSSVLYLSNKDLDILCQGKFSELPMEHPLVKRIEEFRIIECVEQDTYLKDCMILPLLKYAVGVPNHGENYKLYLLEVPKKDCFYCFRILMSGTSLDKYTRNDWYREDIVTDNSPYNRYIRLCKDCFQSHKEYIRYAISCYFYNGTIVQELSQPALSWIHKK